MTRPKKFRTNWEMFTKAIIKFKTQEHIDDYFRRVEEMVNTMRGLGEEVKEIVVVQMVLRSLLAKINWKLWTGEDRENLDALKMDDELHVILIAYEMRTEDRKTKRSCFQSHKEESAK